MSKRRWPVVAGVTYSFFFSFSFTFFLSLTPFSRIAFYSSAVDPHAYGRFRRGDKGSDGADPHAKLLASTSADIRRSKSAFTKGSWNVNAVGLGGLGYDAEELAAARLQGLDEAAAAAEYVLAGACALGRSETRGSFSNPPQPTRHHPDSSPGGMRSCSS